MGLSFRNLVTDPDDPVGTWPLEAILTTLERGDIDDWQRLADEIRREPWGRTARQVEEVLTFSRPYGVAELMEMVIAHSREKADEEERDTVATGVRRFIAESGLSRAEFASRIGTSPSRLSTYATGRVIPSATLILRMERVAAISSEERT